MSAVSLMTLATSLLPVVSTYAAGSVALSPVRYVVKPGDFLAGIAAKVGVTLPVLLSVNNMTSKSLIVPGDTLSLPADAKAPVTPATARVPVAGGLVYTVKWGDFLLGIAAQYKVTLADLLAVNRMNMASVINPGRQLALPANAVAPQVPVPAEAAPGVGAVSALAYTVKFGDFLAGIAASYKVKLADLLAVNKLKASSLIMPGTKLAMPAGAVEPAAPAAPTPPTTPATPSADVQSSAGPVGIVVAYAYAQLGKPYRFFTAGPDTFDCSGLVLAAYSQIGIAMIHHAASQATYGTAVDIWSGDSIRAGDLIFMATHGTAEINHVGIAVDATRWIQATAPGDVVRLSSIPPKGLIATVRRIVPTAGS